MTLDFKSHKTCIFGIQGSGKTYFTRQMYPQFKKPIAFIVNSDDWTGKEKNIYLVKADRKNLQADFKMFIKKVHQLAIEGKVDLIIIDEADLFIQNNWDIDDYLQDIILNHRHLGSEQRKGDGVALWLVTRRPQDIPTKIVESSKYLIIYKLEGANAIKRFGEINPKIPELIDKLDYKRHNFIIKEIGKDPLIHAPLK